MPGTLPPGYKELVMDKVKEPTVWTEFEVQAYLWSNLRQLEFNVRGEVKAVYAGRQRVRFDLAVFEDGNLVGIIEVKARPRKHKNGWENTRQGSRYKQYGVPIRLVYGMDQAQECVLDAEKGRLWGDPWR